MVQGRLLDILLYYILIFWSFHSPLHNAVNLNLSFRIRMLHGCIYSLLDFNKFVKPLLVAFVSFVQLKSHFLNLTRDEYSSALRSRLRLANVKHDRILFRLCLCHSTIINQFFPFICFLFGVFLNFIEICGIHPRLRKEIIVIRKFLLESLKMHSKRALSTDIVHSQEMICSLRVGQTAEEFRRHTAVCPKNVPIIWI